MVNLILAIIISGLVGFLAGHFSTKSSDVAPVSLKEAVTGEVDAPPAQFNLPRPPRAKAKNTAPVMCEQGKSIQEQIALLKFPEMQGICREAERDWQKRNVDNYVVQPASGVEADRAVKEMFDMVKDTMSSSAYWRGEFSLTQGDRSVQLEIFVNFSDGRFGANGAPQPPLNVEQPKDLCLGISPLFTVNGKSLSTGSMSFCGGPLRKHGDGFYFLWQTQNDEILLPLMSAFIVPVPVPGGPGTLEYLNSQTGQWVADPGFHWRASTLLELQEAGERHLKKIDDRQK